MKFKPLKIKSLTAREILNSRGIPTVEAMIETTTGVKTSASVPSGTSKGAHEAVELRDGNHKRYHGMGVFKSVYAINHAVSKNVRAKVIQNPKNLDSILLRMDSTAQKKKLGSNTILAVSLAGSRALAEINGLPLYQYVNKVYALPRITDMPTPMFNIFNGGKHADTNLDIQELMVVPKRKKLMSEKVRMGAEVFYTLGAILRKSGLDTDTGNEGGYAPDIHATTEAIRMIVESIKEAGYIPGKDVGLAIDVGSSTMYDTRLKQYRFKLDAAFYSTNQLITLYEVWKDQYPLMLLEDGLAEDDWHGWSVLCDRLGNDLLIVGDDLFVSNPVRLKRGIKEKAANAIIIKPNQIGTLSETIETVQLARAHNITTIVSHRSGETNDDIISDIAVAVQASYVKFGAPNRGERVGKYNRLMYIEDEIIASHS